MYDTIIITGQFFGFLFFIIGGAATAGLILIACVELFERVQHLHSIAGKKRDAAMQAVEIALRQAEQHDTEKKP